MTRENGNDRKKQKWQREIKTIKKTETAKIDIFYQTRNF